MSEVSIANLALSWLGQDTILSLDPDEGRAARLCATNYPISRDAVLSEASWTFATRRYEFTPIVDTPAYGYSQKFFLPTEVLTVIEVSSNDFDINGASELDWRLEERHIMANVDRVYAKCIIRITDTNQFSSTFVHVLAARIAADLAPAFTESNTKAQQMWALYKDKLATALPTDGRQGKSDRIRGDSLIRVR